MMRPSIIAGLLTLSIATTAAAEPPPGGYEDEPVQYYEEQPQQDPAYDDGQGQYYEEEPAYDQSGQPVATQPQAQPAAQQETVVVQPGERGLLYGANLFVPVWLGPIAGDLKPGIGIHGRAGWEFPMGLSLEGGIGAMVNPDDGIFFEGTLVNVFITGGIRYAFFNPTALVPFVQGMLQVNFFDACDAAGVCSGYTDVAVGFTAGAGLTFEINQFAGIEAGLNFSGTSTGDIVAFGGESFLYYVSPFVGFTLYY